MICPQTKAECAHESCCGHQCFKQVKEIILAAPPKQTLDEFERLVDAFGQYSQVYEVSGSAVSRSHVQKARAALIDYVKRMGVE